ncbi:hypothetical protein Lal_00044647 [Lupinus albus]|nr:hypothetical protein Lal_00044647 [Lupinus albus]
MARDMDSWMQEKEELRHDGQGRLEVLVKWQNLPHQDCTWELATTIWENFPNFKLEDKSDRSGVRFAVHNYCGNGRKQKVQIPETTSSLVRVRLRTSTLCRPH